MAEEYRIVEYGPDGPRDYIPPRKTPRSAPQTAAIAYMGPDWRTWRLPSWQGLLADREVRRRWLADMGIVRNDALAPDEFIVVHPVPQVLHELAELMSPTR